MTVKIGLTGGIAAGKTTVSFLFAKLGVPIIDADEIAKALVAPGQPALKQIIQRFGPTIVQQSGQLDRIKLRQQIFANPRQRQYLEGILHPRIQTIMQTFVTQLKDAYCILSIPLLLETQQMSLMDRILVIDCAKELQRQRLIEHRSLKTEEIESIITAQVSRKARLAIANEVIYNDSDLENLQQQVLVLHQWYKYNLSKL